MAYQPESPRAPPTGLQDKPFVPIYDWETYLEAVKKHDLMMADGNEEFIRRCEERWERVRTQHIQWYIDNPPTPTESVEKYIPPDPHHVHVSISADGKVSIKVNPMGEIFDKYFSNGKKPPLKKYVKALAFNQAPMELLEKLLLKYDTMERRKRADEKLLDDIFSKYNLKTVKAKKATLQQSMSRLTRQNKSKTY